MGIPRPRNPPAVPPSPQPVEDLTPRRIVDYLDRYVVGQDAAKRAVAVGLRNRLRRQRLDPELARDVTPKNIILVGPTGVGKTEIARRLADLVHAPMLKVEATKYTEVGYFGRDVETIARDLVEVGVALVRAEETARVRERAQAAVEETLLDLLMDDALDFDEEPAEPAPGPDREALRARLRAGDLDAERVEVSLVERSSGSMEA